jgi:curved DNA-binding protein CbpA
VKDYYKILNIPRNASSAQVKRAYRDLIKRCHPDINPSQKAAEWTRELNEAYSVLSDVNAKASYDMDLKLEESDEGESKARETAKSQTSGDSRHPPRPEPNFHCEKCNRVDSSLRVSVLWRVGSAFVISQRSPAVKILCSKCRVKETLAANAYTAFLGWWSIPGFFWTLEALFKNAFGGEQPKENNAALLKALSYQLYRADRQSEAYKALAAALKFKPDPESEKILEGLKQSIHLTEQKSFWEKFHSLELHPFYYHAPAGAVFAVLLFFGFHSLYANSDSGPYYPPQKPPTFSTTPPSENPESQPIASDNNSSTTEGASPVFSEPEEPLPEKGGMLFSYSFVTNTGDTAPFKITTPSDGNYVMKIEDWNTKEFVAMYFIPRSSTLSTDLPLGSYRLKFAQGDKWYGTNYLFGPMTIYSYIPNKMDFYLSGDYAEGHEIELIPQINGNLETQPMGVKDW